MRFKASVQYDDWKGTAAADSVAQEDLRSLLLSEGLLTNDEAIVGIKAWIGENQGGKVQPASIEVLVVPLAEYPARLRQDPVKVKCISKAMSVEKFVGLFKRFAIVLSSHDDLGPDRDYETI
jgi:hypothetical protein